MKNIIKNMPHFMRRLKPAATGLLLTAYFLLCAFRLPADSAKELIPVETLQNQINNFKLIAVITLLILAASVAANIILVLYFFRLQNQISEIVQAFKNYNATQDAVSQIADKVRTYTQPKEGDNIEILKRGI